MLRVTPRLLLCGMQLILRIPLLDLSPALLKQSAAKGCQETHSSHHVMRELNTTAQTTTMQATDPTQSGYNATFSFFTSSSHLFLGSMQLILQVLLLGFSLASLELNALLSILQLLQ